MEFVKAVVIRLLKIVYVAIIAYIVYKLES